MEFDGNIELRVAREEEIMTTPRVDISTYYNHVQEFSFKPPKETTFTIPKAQNHVQRSLDALRRAQTKSKTPNSNALIACSA